MAKQDDELTKDQPQTDGAGDTPPESETTEKAAKAKDSVKDSKSADKAADDVKADKVADEAESEKTETVKSTPEVKVSARRRPSAKVAGERAKALAGSVRTPGFRSAAIKLGAVLVALAAVVVLVFGVLIYAYKSTSPAVRAVAGVVPYPAEIVNGRWVSYSDYLFEVDANQKAYQNNLKLNNQPALDFKSKDGQKVLQQIKEHSLDKLKQDAVIAQLASQKKVKVTDKEVDELIGQLYDRYGGKDTLLKTLNQIYGWSLNDLKSVIRKQLLSKNLEDKVTSDPAVDAAAKTKAQDVLKKVKEGGDFAALAKQYSQASDAANGGDLGFFTKGQLPDNVQAAAEALQPDQVSDVIKTQYGYEILKVVEKKDDGSIRGLHILIKTLDFQEYLDAEIKKANVKPLIKI